MTSAAIHYKNWELAQDIASLSPSLSQNFVSAEREGERTEEEEGHHMKRANIGCLDNRDRISDGKTFIQKEEGELSISSSSSSPVTWTELRGSH